VFLLLFVSLNPAAHTIVGFVSRAFIQALEEEELSFERPLKTFCLLAAKAVLTWVGRLLVTNLTPLSLAAAAALTPVASVASPVAATAAASASAVGVTLPAAAATAPVVVVVATSLVVVASLVPAVVATLVVVSVAAVVVAAATAPVTLIVISPVESGGAECLPVELLFCFPVWSVRSALGTFHRLTRDVVEEGLRLVVSRSTAVFAGVSGRLPAVSVAGRDLAFLEFDDVAGFAGSLATIVNHSFPELAQHFFEFVVGLLEIVLAVKLEGFLLALRGPARLETTPSSPAASTPLVMVAATLRSASTALALVATALTSAGTTAASPSSIPARGP